MKKALLHIFSRTIWTLIGLFITLSILIRIPAIQQSIAEAVSSAVEKKLATKVEINRVNLGFFNRIIVDDFLLYDQQGKKMLKAGRLSAKIDLLDLLNGKISISSAQIFGLDAKLYLNNSDEAPNFQFVLDSLASKDTTSHTPLNLQIGSLVIRNSKISYDRKDVPNTPSHFNINHLYIDRLSSHIILYALTDDNIDLDVKHLSFAEKSGLTLNDFTMKLNADKEQLLVRDFELKLPNSSIGMPKLATTYSLNNGKIDFSKSKGEVTINIKSLVPQDIASLIPFATNALPTLYGKINGDIDNGLVHCTTDILTKDNSAEIHLKGIANNVFSHPVWKANEIHINADERLIRNLAEQTSIPQEVLALGSIDINGDLSGRDKSVEGTLDIATSNVGNVNINGKYDTGNISAQIVANELNLNKLLANDDFGTLSAKIDASALLNPQNKPTKISANGNVSEFYYNGYNYRDITLEGNYDNDIVKYILNISDPNIAFNVDGNTNIGGARKSISANINIENIAPQQLNLSSKWGNATFSLQCSGNVSGSNIDDITGDIQITDFTQYGGEMGDDKYDDTFHIDNISISSILNKNSRRIALNSDVMDVEANGDFKVSTLANSLTGLVANYLPSLISGKERKSQHNNFTLNATLKSSEWLKRLLGVDIDVQQPLTCKGFVNDDDKQANIYVEAPEMTFSNHHFEDIKLLLWNPENTMRSNISMVMQDNPRKPGTEINIEATAQENKIASVLSWNKNDKNDFKGIINTTTQFSRNGNGSLSTRLSISPSDIQIGDSIWHLHSKGIEYADNNLIVDHFAIENSNQHVYINGKASSSPDDVITADLKNVDVAYIMNLVNFHSVEFGGYASGQATARALFSTPEATAHLDVDEFLFEEGHMGDLHVDAVLNNIDRQIDIDGYTDDEKGKVMVIKGFVSPQKDGLDLDIEAKHVSLEFMKSYCSAFLEDIDAEARGRVRVYGPFSTINLTGQVVADGAVTVTPLNCRYTLKNDTVNFIPDDIILNRIPIYDKYGNIAYMSGGLHHKHLTRLTYDFDINATNFLAYDFKEFGESTFYGTAYLTGLCSLKGRSSELDINVDGNVEKGSRIVYNAASPDAITKQEFITWHSKNDKTENDSATSDEKERNDDDVRTNIRMNFLFNVTPESSLYLLMDPNTGDYIDLHGSGGLRASYYNKGSFDLFGNYLIESGTYKMTIQNVIRRDFAFQPGGTITFGGDPYNASLKMQALYTVNSVPLSDLNIGTSFSSNNIRVNCLMNISGTPGSPQVEFDMDLPTVNSEAKQMVYSLINSEEEMNQQVLYLLSVGRFYSQTGNNAGMQDEKASSATTLAMQSIVSGTLSQQINNVLSSVIKNRNWNFGANISPGDEGFTNAEYEGLLNGSLFNNRLLFNGQFGYRDNALTAQQGFIGDFDLRYLLVPNGNFAVRVYNQANDRYFTRNSLNTQGLGLILKKDFSSWRELFRKRKKITKKDTTKSQDSKVTDSLETTERK